MAPWHVVSCHKAELLDWDPRVACSSSRACQPTGSAMFSFAKLICHDNRWLCTSVVIVILVVPPQYCAME